MLIGSNFIGWVTDCSNCCSVSKRINEFMSIQSNIKQGDVYKKLILGNITFSEVF